MTFDLTGLPPTSEEVDAFVSESIGNRQSAIDNLLTRLLASPHYGERWGRHWLDVARYSDTKGYVYAREERFFVHAWAYRDWVVKASTTICPMTASSCCNWPRINSSRQARPISRRWASSPVERRFIGVTRDIIDDRIDVVMRGTMALTVACARCHDHKYDPIPTRDYYSLYGVFGACEEKLVSLGAETANSSIGNTRRSSPAP